MTVKSLTAKNFDEFIKSGVSVIDFHADWCNPCRILSPSVEKASEEMKGVKFGKVDVDKESKLAQRFYVMSIPTLIFFKNKEQVERMVGAVSKEELVNKIRSVFKNK